MVFSSIGWHCCLSHKIGDYQENSISSPVCSPTKMLKVVDAPSTSRLARSQQWNNQNNRINNRNKNKQNYSNKKPTTMMGRNNQQSKQKPRKYHTCKSVLIQVQPTIRVTSFNSSATYFIHSYRLKLLMLFRVFSLGRGFTS